MYLYDIILITEDNIAGQLLASMIFIRMPAKDVKTVGDLTNQRWNKQKKMYQPSNTNTVCIVTKKTSCE